MNAIVAQELTKHYQVYRRPFDRLKQAIFRRPFHDLVEALSDVSFEVPVGGTLGIIGENGAGKSTLLKILAGTVRPTSGQFEERGRIAALLELGSGFHPEFSGRQNIYLNAALLGLKEKEIKDREASIIAFSELKDAIDRPVKTYSSGMHMRLAFSIATSVDPDILIIDEALSVGDQRFQRKCVDRMMGFRKADKTIIICSHSMYLINELCSRAIWLKNGRMQRDDNTPNVVAAYLAYQEDEEGAARNGLHQLPADNLNVPDILIEDVRLKNEKGETLDTVRQFESVTIEVKTKRTGSPVRGHLAVGFGFTSGKQVFATTTKMSGLAPILFFDRQITELRIPSIPILGGNYVVKAWVGDEHALRLIDQKSVGPFVISSDHPEIGMMWMAHSWKMPEASVTEH